MENLETKQYVMTNDQIAKFEKIEFLYNESQIDYHQYKKELLEILPNECVQTTNVLTGYYDGHTYEQLTIINVANLPIDEDDM